MSGSDPTRPVVCLLLPSRNAQTPGKSGHVTQVSLTMEGPNAGQFLLEPEDDYYTDRTAMTREQAARLIGLLRELWNVQ